MKKKVAIYLAGTIKKHHERHDETYWTDLDMETIRHHLQGCEVSFLNPAFRTDDLSDQRSVFGRDMLQVFCSDFVFVDARDRRGLGVGAEMMWAKVNRIPVLTWAPKGSHYHLHKATILGVPVENYVHPFVESLSDKFVENVSDGAHWMLQILNDPSSQIKGLEYIAAAMEHYKERQLPLDMPMHELINACEVLKQRTARTPTFA